MGKPGHQCRDAVIVLPGMLGSELVASASGAVLWGWSDPREYVRLWTSGDRLAALTTTDAERTGHGGRVEARRLLRYPAFAPVLRGMEPYTRLLAGVTQVLAHPAALRTFPYDWRMSVQHNAFLLADVAGDHLARWRAHPSGSRDARLVLVAHGLGGLIARYFAVALAGGEAVSATIMLGTPSSGSVKVLSALSSATDAPLPHRLFHELARALPGLYALLPTDRCVDDGTSVRRLTATDVAVLGADAGLAGQLVIPHDPLREAGSVTHRVIGVEQPTEQSALLRHGTVRLRQYTCEDDGIGGVLRTDLRGDGLVPCPTSFDPPWMSVPQTHGALAATDVVIGAVQAILTGAEPEPLVGGRLGLDVPDLVEARRQFEITIRNPGRSVTAASCCIVDVSTGAAANVSVQSSGGGLLVGSTSAPAPGLYRVVATAGASHTVTDLTLAVPPHR